MAAAPMLHCRLRSSLQKRDYREPNPSRGQADCNQSLWNHPPQSCPGRGWRRGIWSPGPWPAPASLLSRVWPLAAACERHLDLALAVSSCQWAAAFPQGALRSRKQGVKEGGEGGEPPPGCSQVGGAGERLPRHPWSCHLPGRVSARPLSQVRHGLALLPGLCPGWSLCRKPLPTSPLLAEGRAAPLCPAQIPTLMPRAHTACPHRAALIHRLPPHLGGVSWGSRHREAAGWLVL